MSDIKKGVAGAAVVWFLNRISEQHWSVGASFAILLLLLAIAWWFLKPYILGSKEVPIQKTEKRPRRKAKAQHAPIGLTVGVVAVIVALLSGWTALVRLHTESVALGLSSVADEYWKAHCLGTKAAQLIGKKFDAYQFMAKTSKLNPNRQTQLILMAIQELQQKKVIKNVRMEPNPLRNADIVKSSWTPLGERLCTYYLAACKPPKEASKAQ